MCHGEARRVWRGNRRDRRFRARPENRGAGQEQHAPCMLFSVSSSHESPRRHSDPFCAVPDSADIRQSVKVTPPRHISSSDPSPQWTNRGFCLTPPTTG